MIPPRASWITATIRVIPITAVITPAAIMDTVGPRPEYPLALTSAAVATVVAAITAVAVVDGMVVVAAADTAAIIEQ